jgi:hypothetical protein
MTTRTAFKSLQKENAVEANLEQRPGLVRPEFEEGRIPEPVLAEVHRLLHSGHWSEGLALSDTILGPTSRRLPHWRGEDCDYLLLHLSGGLGDIVMFSRFFPVLQQRGIHLICDYVDTNSEGKAQLLEVIRKQDWCDPDSLTHGHFQEITPGPGRFWMDLSDMAHIFQLSPETVGEWPSPLWELEPSTDIRPSDGNIIIGLCTESSKRPDLGRSLSSSQVARLVASFPSVRWVNLNPWVTLDLPNVCNPPRDTVTKLGSLIAACDSVITVDTFQAHFAAALGKDTSMLLLNPELTSWIWAKDPPWYSSMKYFRDREDVGLDDAVGQIIASLKNLV